MADTDGQGGQGGQGTGAWAHPSGESTTPPVFSPVPLPPAPPQSPTFLNDSPPLPPVPPPFQSAPSPQFQTPAPQGYPIAPHPAFQGAPPPPHQGAPPPPFQGAPPPPFQGAPTAQPGAHWAGNMAGMLASKPGIIPLRPLSMGEVFDASIKAIRFNPAVMLGFAAITMFLVSALQTLAMWQFGASASLVTTLNTGSSPDSLEAFQDSMGNLLILTLVVSVIGAIIQLAVLAVGTVAVAKAVLGTKVTLGDAWRAVKSRIWRLFLVSLLIGLIFTGGLIVASILTVIVSMVTLGIGALIAFPAMGLGMLWLWARLFSALPIVLLEDTGAGAAVSRAWRLSGARQWPLIGVWALTGLIMFIFNMVFSIPVSVIAAMVPGSGSSWVYALVLFASTFLSSLLIVPIVTAVSTLLYTDLRMRLEGFDIQLAQLSGAGGR